LVVSFFARNARYLANLLVEHAAAAEAEAIMSDEVRAGSQL